MEVKRRLKTVIERPIPIFCSNCSGSDSGSRGQELREMEEIRSLLMNLQRAGIVPLASNSGVVARFGNEKAHNRIIQPQLTRLEFPKFNGERLHEWVGRCIQFFELDCTPENTKVKIASLHMEDRALQWHQNFMKGRLSGEFPVWGEYVSALNSKFGSELHYDPMKELKDLRQLGSVQTYLDKFDELLNKVSLSTEHTLSLFLDGLKE